MQKIKAKGLDDSNQFEKQIIHPRGCMLTYIIEETLEGHKDQIQIMHIRWNMEPSTGAVFDPAQPQCFNERGIQSHHKDKNITKRLNENDFGIGVILMNFCGKGMLS
jgi:hypothetical protein